MIGHKYTPTVGHTGSYAFGDHVRRNLGATVVELGIPPALAVGSVNTIKVEDDKLVSLIEADTDAYRKNFIEKLACHEIWYSPIVERKFFVLKNDEEEICRRLARLLEKIAGVKLFDKFN